MGSLPIGSYILIAATLIYGMHNIHQHEEFVLKTLQAKFNITDAEGKKHAVPVIYANDEKVQTCILNPTKSKDGVYLETAETPDRLRLPLVGFTLIEAGYSKLVFAGTIYTMFRRDLNDLIGQCWDIQNECDLTKRISFSNFKIDGKDINEVCAGFALSEKVKGVRVSKATFTFAYEL